MTTPGIRGHVADLRDGLTDAQAAAQLAAELMWAIATSDDHAVAAWDSPVYLAAERTLITAIRQGYGMTRLQAGKVRNLLAEYGPDDVMQGTRPARGIASYAAYILAHPRKRIG